tara:strand:- start:1566 stop:2402 length:837 start_codon:yes stop_codon:yes gene_type:complete
MSTEKVEINSAVAEKTTEQQVQDLKEQGIDINTLESEDGSRVIASEPDTQTQNTENQRPEWLPEKFKNAEELSKAYSELEKQFSGKKAEPVKKDDDDLTIPKDEDKTFENETSPQLNSLDKYSEEYAENGELGEASYGELAKQGLSKELVDGYIAGQKAIADTQTAEIHSVVGGKPEYDELITWAGTNLSEAEQTAFNDLTATGTTEQIKMAVQGLMTKAGVTATSQQKFVQGDVNNISTEQFTSVSQVTDAMNDPRYDKDPVYRKEVERKLGNSSVF